MSEAHAPVSFSLLIAIIPTLGLMLAVLLFWRRRQEIKRFERSHNARSDAISKGSHKGRLLYPDIDLSKCIGCGTCVRACPEDGVLDLLHGQAVVIHGARCVGHGRCAEACPTGGIALTFADLAARSDLPAITEEFEAVGVPGLFVAGELSGFSLVRTAVSHGTTVANVVAKRCGKDRANDEIPDLLIVGMGPAGLACALRAKELGLSFEMIEQADEVGGTVVSYPRRKMVMTQPIQLPLHGKLPRSEYQKEELVELWQGLVQKHQLPVKLGMRLMDVTRESAGTLSAQTNKGALQARNIVLCLGRRGTPRKLNVPGEDLTKVAYSLMDAESYRGRRILVVGGGDSAAEAAIGLSEQEGNTVTLASRDKDWVRVKAKNEARIREAVHAKRLHLLMESSTKQIDAETVTLQRAVNGAEEEVTIPNDDVFVFAGGDPPFALLQRAGVSFDPAKRPKPIATGDNATPLLWATGLLLACSIAMVIWGASHLDYYGASAPARIMDSQNRWLRPTGAFGLSMGLLAVGLFLWNLNYLARRNRFVGSLLPGSLRFWMASHVFTGLGSFLAVIVHAGFTYRVTVGGYAFIALGIVLVAGLVGRYFYAIVPHAANGREMDLDELRSRLVHMATTWEKSSRGLAKTVQERIETLVKQDRWKPSLFARAASMMTSHLRIRKVLNELRKDPGFLEVPASEREELLQLAKRSYRLTMQITHYEEIRSVLGTWRFIHGWLALLMVLFVVAHIVTAVRYARLDWPYGRSHTTAKLENAP